MALGIDSAATTVTAGRDQRIRVSGAGLAFAYLMLLANNDFVRASMALSVFQSFWNQNFDTIRVAAASALTRLPVDGQYPGDTARSVGWMIWRYIQSQAVRDAVAREWPLDSAGRAAEFYRSRMMVATAQDPLRGIAEELVASLNQVQPVDATGVIRRWLTAYVDQQFFDPPSPQTSSQTVLQDFDSIIDDLARTPQADATLLPAELIVGSRPTPRKSPLWPWVIGGGAVTLLGLGLYFRKKKRG